MTHRKRWLWCLATSSVVAMAALQWWWPSSDGAVVLAPIAMAAPVLAPVIAPIPVPPPAKPIDAVPAAPAFKVVGTVRAANSADSFALVRRTSDSQVVRLRNGDRLDGLTVSAIESNTVVLTGAGQPVVIEADRSAPVPRAVALPPAPDVEPAWAGDPEPFGH